MNVDNPSPTPEKLPCRGCTANCPNRDRCDGKPWRLPVAGHLKTVPAVISVRVLNALR